METPEFFERDQDEFVFRDKIYLDYFNLYPCLWFDSTYEHIQTLDEMTVLGTKNHSDGWQIAAKFCDFNFLLDTHYHGTSTMFCAEKCVSDNTAMLAFLGCFLPTIRDSWQRSEKMDTRMSSWIAKLFQRN